VISRNCFGGNLEVRIKNEEVVKKGVWIPGIRGFEH
jgi:hypothetical protein